MTDPLRDKLDQAADRADAASQAFYNVLTFGRETPVPVEGGTVESMSKRIYDQVGASIDAIEEKANQAIQAAQVAEDAKNSAQADAAAAGEAKDGAEAAQSASATSATQAQASATAASGSASAAQNYANSASDSANATSTSAGDAVAAKDAAVAAKDQAQASASAAGTSAANAGNSATNASAAASSAATSETNAKGYSDSAMAYRDEAENHATDSEASATAASGSASAASASASYAQTSASSAQSSAATASTAASDATAAKNEAVDAKSQAQAASSSAQSYASYAVNSATNALASENAAAASEVNALAYANQAKEDAESSDVNAHAAQVSANSAANNASVAQAAAIDSGQSKVDAAGYADAAASSEINAKNAESNAEDYAESALNSAQDAQAIKDSFTEFDGDIQPDASWVAVPAHKDSALNAQAQALANRTEALKQRTDKSVLSYPDYAAATAAAATLPNGQVVDVAENNTRYDVSGGALTNTRPTTPVSVVLGIVRSVQEKVKDFPSAKDSGAVGNGVALDTAALASASAIKMVSLGSATYKTAGLSLASGCKSDGAKIKISGRQDNLAAPLFSGKLLGELTIEGDAPVTADVISASVFFSGTFQTQYYFGDFRSAKYQLVDIVLSEPAHVGNMLLVRADQPELSGCFEVVAVPATNTARVLMLAQGMLNVSSFSGAAKILTTVLQFGNFRVIDVSNGSLHLKNIGILGACYPVENGSRSNIYDPSGAGAGVTGVVAREGGTVKATDCGISGISGTQVSGVDSGNVDFSAAYVSCGGRNGVSASYGKLTFGGGVSTQNLLDNVIAQDQSFAFSTFCISAHAGRHGFISSSGSTINLSNGNSQQNGFLDPTNGDGVNASSSNVTFIGATIKNNANAGVDVSGLGDGRGTGATITGNQYGVKSQTESHVLVTGNITGNTVYDLQSNYGGKIEAVGATYGTTDPPAEKTDGTGALVQVTSTVPVLASSGGLSTGRTGVTSPSVNDGNIFSGTYTPAATAVTNVASVTPTVCHYARLGGMVIIGGIVNVTPSATGRITFRMSLPVPSDLSSARHAGGTFSANGVAAVCCGGVTADAATDTLVFDGVAGEASNRTYSFQVCYLVL